MTGDQFRGIRYDMGLSVFEFARHLGYGGTVKNAGRLIRRYESGQRPIPDHIAERARTIGPAVQKVMQEFEP